MDDRNGRAFWEWMSLLGPYLVLLCLCLCVAIPGFWGGSAWARAADWVLLAAAVVVVPLWLTGWILADRWHKTTVTSVLAACAVLSFLFRVLQGTVGGGRDSAVEEILLCALLVTRFLLRTAWERRGRVPTA